MVLGRFKEVICDSDGNELLMIRTDITMWEMMNEKPAGRWDPEYWHPKYDVVYETKYTLRRLGEFIKEITYGVILTGHERNFSRSGVNYVSATTVRDTGIDHSLNPLFVRKDDPRNRLDKKPRRGDLILNRSGIGTLGRQCVFTYDPDDWTISDDTDVIRLEGISPFYISIFLKSRFGQLQISQRTRGVSGLVKLNFDDIKEIKVPLLSQQIQGSIDQEYKKMSAFHDKAMEAKAKGDQVGYQRNIQIAERMLKDLISRTEEVIRGERDDVI